MKQQNPYLVFDAINQEYDECTTPECARKRLEDAFLSDYEDEGYHPDLVHCKIYQLMETVSYDVVDSKENYKYESVDDVPEFENVDEADANDSDDVWPYDSTFDEIWKHKFMPVVPVTYNESDIINAIHKVELEDGKDYSKIGNSIVEALKQNR